MTGRSSSVPTEPRSGRHREGAKRVSPLAPASASFGVAFGVLAVTAGMGVVAPIVMSATTFAGAAQFAAASVLRDGGSVLAAVAAAVLLNARYLAISIAIAPAFQGSRLRRFFE
jgi:predicted branched-subunit amino acid permease